jgi:catechol-2,3-dioxygenase
MTGMKPKLVDHIVLNVTDVERSERFYSSFLGKPESKDKYSVSYRVGSTKVFLILPYHKAKDNRWNADKIGLNHLAFGVSTHEELKKMKALLEKAGIGHSNIGIDKYGKKPFIWFDDPDGIRLEFYLRSTRA